MCDACTYVIVVIGCHNVLLSFLLCHCMLTCPHSPSCTPHPPHPHPSPIPHTPPSVPPDLHTPPSPHYPNTPHPPPPPLQTGPSLRPAPAPTAPTATKPPAAGLSLADGDAYEELFPDFQREFGEEFAGDDEENLMHADDVQLKKGTVKQRHDFATQEEYDKYKLQQETMPRAAFQFGVKKGDGRVGSLK